MIGETPKDNGTVGLAAGQCDEIIPAVHLHLPRAGTGEPRAPEHPGFAILDRHKRDVTAETAILLSRTLKTSSEFWMNLQVAYDLYKVTPGLWTPPGTA